jgi:hypothetical protein
MQPSQAPKIGLALALVVGGGVGWATNVLLGAVAGVVTLLGVIVLDARGRSRTEMLMLGDRFEQVMQHIWHGAPNLPELQLRARYDEQRFFLEARNVGAAPLVVELPAGLELMVEQDGAIVRRDQPPAQGSQTLSPEPPIDQPLGLMDRPAAVSLEIDLAALAAGLAPGVYRLIARFRGGELGAWAFVPPREPPNRP